MHDDRVPQPPAPITIDDYIRDLGRLRTDAGNPSYGEIALRIARRREANGVSAAGARIARSTVYDVFRPGRRRLDIGLVREILVAIGLDETDVGRWVELGRRAAPGATATEAGAETGTETDSVEDAEQPQDPAPPLPSPPALPVVQPIPDPDPGRSRHRWATFLVGCLAMNLVGRVLAQVLDLPLHLDMVGTATAAIVAGPWWGVLVGVATNGVGATLTGADSLPFALVNVTGALVWGYGVRRFGMGRTIPRFFMLNIICGVACSAVAAPILLLLYGGGVREGVDALTDTLFGLTHVLIVSVFLSNILVSLADKIISGFIALAVAEARSAERTPLTLSPDGPVHQLPPAADPGRPHDHHAPARRPEGRGERDPS